MLITAAAEQAIVIHVARDPERDAEGNRHARALCGAIEGVVGEQVHEVRISDPQYTFRACKRCRTILGHALF